MPDLLDMIDEIDIEVNPPVEKTIEIKDSKPPTPVNKKPPKAPKPPKVEIQKISDNFFVELANSSEFKRFIYKVLYGKVHRTEKQHGNLDEKVKIGLQIFQDPKFSGIVKEMKGMFNNGFFKPSEIKTKSEIIKTEGES